MDNKDNNMELKKKIIIFRGKLHSLLSDGNSNPEKVLKLSQELDKLVVQYYHAKRSETDK